jgi:hypothetical protein
MLQGRRQTGAGELHDIVQARVQLALDQDDIENDADRGKRNQY